MSTTKHLQLPQSSWLDHRIRRRQDTVLPVGPRAVLSKPGTDGRGAACGANLRRRWATQGLKAMLLTFPPTKYGAPLDLGRFKAAFFTPTPADDRLRSWSERGWHLRLEELAADEWDNCAVPIPFFSPSPPCHLAMSSSGWPLFRRRGPLLRVAQPCWAGAPCSAADQTRRTKLRSLLILPELTGWGSPFATV